VTQNPRIRLLFAASATIFFTRAMLFSTWQSRAPEVQQMLHLNTAQMGLLAMLYPAGGLLGLLNANYLNQRFGSRRVTVVGFALAAVGLATLGFTVPAGSLPLTAITLVLMGLPMGVADFIGNFEGADVDRKATRSLLPAIHSIFGIGMMAAAGIASLLSASSVSLTTNYLLVAIVVALPSVWAGITFPKRAATIEGPESKAQHRATSRKVWTEPVTWIVAAVAFAFGLAELSAGTWVTIALAGIGMTNAEAAAAFGLFWIAITVGRIFGGFAVDKIGLRRTLIVSAVATAVGVSMFTLNQQLHLPYLALIVWGLGMANGIPLAINAMSDHSPMSAARINMIITICYASMLSAGPALGALGQVVGIQLAFGLPVALLVVAAFLARVVRR